MTTSPESGRLDERKLVTILFADLVGSTELGERLDPERLQAVLQTYFAAMSEIIARWGGVVEKFIGDAIMAVFGVPTSHEDDPRRAIGAAVEMLARIDDLNTQFRDRFDIALQARIGINTGTVMAPVGGPAEQIIVVGDAVNVAARLEQAAGPGTVLVADRTQRAAAVDYRFDGPRTLELRGKSQGIVAWEVRGPRTDAPAADAEGSRPLVGREREHRALLNALEDAIESGTPRLALVFGPAGIGKSRLVRELTTAAAADWPDLHAVRGRCLSAGDGITYWALGEIVRTEFGIALDDPAERARQQLEAGVGALFAGRGLPDADVAQTIFALATSAGIRVPSNPLDDLRPIAVSNELMRAWPRFVSARAAAGPLVILVEDLHWADGQLLAILDTIRTRSSGAILVVATARPEFVEAHPEFGIAREGATSLTLRPLRPGEADDLLVGLVGGELPSGIRSELLERAEGNPFFLEQLVGGLTDAGAFERQGRRLAFRRGARAGELPDTVQSVLAARIDSLALDEKRVVQEAAIVGRIFWPAAVSLTLDPATVEGALSSLEAKDLVFARQASSVGGETEYLFKHALIQDVAYASVPFARRAGSHARVAAWLQALGGDADEAVIELVAHHYRRALLADGADLAWATDPEAHAAVRARGLAAIVAAGAIARRRNAIDRAVELHEDALRLAIDDEERAAAYEELGDDHGWGYHGDPSLEAWNRALALRRAGSDGEAVARICVKAARSCVLYWGGFSSRPSGAMVDAYVDEGLGRVEEPLTRAWLLALRGRAAEAWSGTELRDPVGRNERQAAAEEAVTIARSLGDANLQLIATRTLGELAINAGDDRRALASALAELDAAEHLTAGRDRLLAIQQAGGVAMDITGDFEAGVQRFEAMLPVAREMTVHELMHATYFVMAALFRLARWEDIVPLAREHLDAYDRETVDMECPYTRSGPVVAAIVFDRLGLSDAAAEATKRIAPNHERPGLPEAWMAERALWQRELSEARAIAERVVKAGHPPSFVEPPYELPVLVKAIAAAGDWQAFAELLPSVTSKTGRLAWLQPAIDHARGIHEVADGNRADGMALLDRALEQYSRLGMVAEADAERQQLSTLSLA